MWKNHIKMIFFSNRHLVIYLPSTTDYNHCIEQEVGILKETIIDTKN